MLWVVVVVVVFGDRPGDLQRLLAALPAPIPTIPKTNRAVTTERPSTLMTFGARTTPCVYPHLALPPTRSEQSGSLQGIGIGALRGFLVRFGNPANSESPVALRPLLAKGLPFVVGHQVGHRTTVNVNWLHR